MSTEAGDDVMDDRLWKKAGWIARVIKNEDDEGWAVAMTRSGDDEPALVGPWTMGRDKKNPKPLDAGAFATLVKTANEVLLRHEQAERARMHKSLSVVSDTDQRIRVELDIARDEDDPHALLAAYEADSGELIHRTRVSPTFKLTQSAARRFAQSGET
jgi:hypothetical protein